MGLFPDQNLLLNRTIVLFAAFSFMGWILEVCYRSVTNRRLVNAGYLYGPFVPIYGFGGIVVMFAGIFLSRLSLPVQILSFAVLTTLLELVVGIALKQLFGCRLWSYEGYRFNFRGIICLKYSFIWAGIACLFYYLIFPVTYLALCRVPDSGARIFAAVFLLYLATDLVFSTLAMLDFARRIRALYEGISSLNNADLQMLTGRFRRILAAFPDLGHFIERVVHDGVSEKLNSLLAKMPSSSRSSKPTRAKKEHGSEAEFLDIVKDILANKEYRKLRNFYHHSTTIYEHVQYVSFLSYRMAKAMGLDYRSTARGAMLHDFFLYDWHTHDLPDLAKDKNHGIAHPKIALENARRNFILNRVEEDIIVKHMWPLTIIPPRYLESYIVTFADKVCASREYTGKLKHFITIRSLRKRRTVK